MFNIRGCCSACSDMKILFAAFLFLLCGGRAFLFVHNEVIICSCVVVVVIVGYGRNVPYNPYMV